MKNSYFDLNIEFDFQQAFEYMTLVEQKFREKCFYQPLFPGMWFNQRELTLPEGIPRFLRI